MWDAWQRSLVEASWERRWEVREASARPRSSLERRRHRFSQEAGKVTEKRQTGVVLLPHKRHVDGTALLAGICL